jgi:hypothetical protein
MLTILLQIVKVFIPEFPVLVVEIEVQSAMFAVGVFVFLCTQLWLDSRA